MGRCSQQQPPSCGSNAHGVLWRRAKPTTLSGHNSVKAAGQLGGGVFSNSQRVTDAARVGDAQPPAKRRSHNHTGALPAADRLDGNIVGLKLSSNEKLRGNKRRQGCMRQRVHRRSGGRPHRCAARCHHHRAFAYPTTPTPTPTSARARDERAVSPNPPPAERPRRHDHRNPCR